MDNSHGASFPTPDPEAAKAGEISRLIDAAIPGAFDGLGDERYAELESRIGAELRREPEKPLTQSDTATTSKRERDGLVDPDAVYRLRLPQRGVANA